MNRFNNVCNQAKKNQQLLRNLQLSLVIRNKWQEIVGSYLADHLFFDYIRDTVCVISVKNPCWITEIQRYEKMVLAKINKQIKNRKKIHVIKVVMENEDVKEKQPFANNTNYDNMIGR